MILSYNFLLSNNRLRFRIQYHFRAFTHDLILSTSLELLLFVPGVIPVQWNFISSPGMYTWWYNDLLVYFTGWYTFLLQEVRKRFFCFKKKKIKKSTGQNHLLRLKRSYLNDFVKYIMQRYTYLFILDSDAIFSY